MARFNDLIKIRKATTCPTCQSFIYQLPIEITSDIDQHLAVLGQLQFPLAQFKVITLETEAIQISGMVGRTELRVKYKKNHDSMRVLIQACLTNWLSTKNVQVE